MVLFIYNLIYNGFTKGNFGSPLNLPKNIELFDMLVARRKIDMQKTTVLTSLIISALICHTARAGVPQPQTQTLIVRGKITEKSAFKLMGTFVQNAGAKMDQYPYEDYHVELAQIHDVAPEDMPALQNALTRRIVTKDMGGRPMKFAIARADVANNTLYMVGEHLINRPYILRLAIDKVLHGTSTPSGHKYSSTLSQQKGIYVPAIPVGDTAGGCGKKMSHLINVRLDQDNLIFNADMFVVDIESISLMVR